MKPGRRVRQKNIQVKKTRPKHGASLGKANRGIRLRADTGRVIPTGGSGRRTGRTVRWKSERFSVKIM